MMGVVSLGHWIDHARENPYYDEMFFLVLLGAAIVLAGDLVSAVARRVGRREGGPPYGANSSASVTSTFSAVTWSRRPSRLPRRLLSIVRI